MLIESFNNKLNLLFIANYLIIITSTTIIIEISITNNTPTAVAVITTASEKPVAEGKVLIVIVDEVEGVCVISFS